MSYTVTLSARDVETLAWLADHGYDGGLYDLAHWTDLEDGNGGPEVYRLTLTEPQAWEFAANVEADPHAFLACNGSETLSEALHGLLGRIV